MTSTTLASVGRYALDILCFMGRWFSDRTFDRVIFKLLGLDQRIGNSSNGR